MVLSPTDMLMNLSYSTQYAVQRPSEPIVLAYALIYILYPAPRSLGHIPMQQTCRNPQKSSYLEDNTGQHRAYVCALSLPLEELTFQTLWQRALPAACVASAAIYSPSMPSSFQMVPKHCTSPCVLESSILQGRPLSRVRTTSWG